MFVYEKLRVCVRGFSEGKSEACKQATTFVLAKTSNFLYTVCLLHKSKILINFLSLFMQGKKDYQEKLFAHFQLS
ncbi:MAG TPA: hypothetical protein VGA80_03400, partial [Flavobacteriaceae bacterium]